MAFLILMEYIHGVLEVFLWLFRGLIVASSLDDVQNIWPSRRLPIYL
jgi:hypothetical protein